MEIYEFELIIELIKKNEEVVAFGIEAKSRKIQNLAIMNLKIID